MKKRFKLGVIGCGVTARAILKGVVLSDFLHEKKIIVSDGNEENLHKINRLGVQTTDNNRYVAENCEFLLLAVKQKDFAEAAANLKCCSHEKVISVVGGYTKNAIKKHFGSGAVKVARCIPNLPCVIGSGAIGVDMSDFNNSQIGRAHV